MKRSLLSLILCWIVRGVHGTGSGNVLEPFDTVDIAEEMLIGGTQLPESLQGLYWMDGNPAREVAVSFGGSLWDADARTIVVSPADEGVWAYNDDIRGRLQYSILVDSVYAKASFQFNEDITEAEASVNLRVLGINIPLPRWFASYRMFLAEDGLWVRESAIIFFIRLTDGYNLRRIVTADGEPTDFFDDFVASNPATLLVPRRPR